MSIKPKARDGGATVPVLYYLNNEKKHLSEDMMSYCHDNTICRRLMLMSFFGISSEIKQPSVPHKCCDVCSRTCTCSECTNALLSFESLAPSDLIDTALPECIKPAHTHTPI